MNEKLTNYLNEVLAPYNGVKSATELKADLLSDLQERFRELKAEGKDDETAFHATIGVVSGYSAMMSERERNMIWRLFTPPVLQEESEEWKKLARVFLAQFRAGYGRFINDPWWGTQIAELSRISPAFRELWACHDVLNRPEGWKSIHHPLVGELTLDFFLLQAVDSYDLRLLIYSPRSNSGTAEKIERLMDVYS